MCGKKWMLRAVLVAGSLGFVSDAAFAGRLISLGANTQAGGVNLDGSVVVGSGLHGDPAAPGFRR